ncbi:MAG: CAP domain-containing protein [Maricaulaceae bacterium]
MRFLSVLSFGLAGLYLQLSSLPAYAQVEDGMKIFDRAVDQLPDTAYLGAQDKGTFRVESVSSQKACMALCKTEPLCRGAVTYQPDISQPDMECRLNNGLAQGSPFEVKAPTALDLPQILADLNAYRAEHDLDPVKFDEKLIKASQVHAEDLAKHGIAAHEGTDGSRHSDRVQRQAYYFSIAGENVATGQKSWEAVFDAWQKSDGHNVNLLMAEAVDFGIALVYEPTTTYATYWTMLMAAPLADFEHLQGAMTPDQALLLEN